MYSRPILCRLCEFPVADDGVRMAELDLQKLARWWLQEFETEFDDDSDTIESSWICQFCLCDARFKFVEENQHSECNWWACKISQTFKIWNLQGDALHQCSVRISNLQLPTTPKNSEEEAVTITNSTKCNKSHIETMCLICGVYFESRKKCFWHVLTAHENSTTFSCKSCFLVFKSKKERDLHFETHGYGNKKCHSCSARFNTFSGLWEHVNSKHGKHGVVTCCNVLVKNINDLSRHIRPAFFGPKTCIYCERLVTSSGLNHHLRKHHKSVAIRCIYTNCNTYFLSEEDKQEHILKVHENDKKFQCRYCPMKFDRSRIHQHVLRLHRNVAIRCKFKQCTTYFCAEEERQQHISLVHKPRVQIRQSVVCIYCKKTFAKLYTLNIHVKKFHDHVMVCCAFQGCSQYFFNKSDFKIHFNDKHAAEEPKKKLHCTKCDFKTHNPLSLRHHDILMHGTENLPCDKCFRTFNSSMALRNHMNQKHRVQNICEHCNKSYFYLQQHLQVIPCKHCGAVKECISAQRAHVKKCKRTQIKPW